MPNCTTESQSDSFSFIDCDTRKICQTYLEALNSPTSLGIWLALKYGDDVSACSHEVDPRHYTEPNIFRSDYQAAMLLSKFASGRKDQDQQRRIAAKEKFTACEEHIASVLTSLKNCDRDNPVVSRVLYSAREKIAKTLGDLNASELVDLCSFGPGSSSSVPRRKAHPSNKFLSADVTASAAPFVSWFFQDAGYPRPKLNLVEVSRVEFVPKNFKSDRIIAIEPDWNIFFQKGVGALIRRAMKRVGVDLDHQSELHGHLARTSSLDGKLATLDLSSASDTISLALVRFLLPDRWFVVLNSLRTNAVQIDGENQYVHKFSSMGNGFTFELESLIFYSLAYAASKEVGTQGTVSTFGDDIILPTGAVELFKTVLQVCGFRLNQQKSYSTSYFRESCGYHFFDGKDVKPLYVKGNIRNDIERYKFCNALRRLAHRVYGTDVHSSILSHTYALCANRVRRKLLIPDGYGDGGLISYFDEVCPATVRRGDPDIYKYPDGIEGFRVRCLQPVMAGAEVLHGGLLMHRLRQAVLRRKSIWHQAGTPLFRVTVSDLKRVDFLPEIGNSLNFSQSNVSYRKGTMRVPRWFDPGEI